MSVSMILLTCALAQQPATLDVSAARASFTVLTDGKQHFLVLDASKNVSAEVFYGDGKRFQKLRVKGGSARGSEAFELALWDPRVLPGAQGSVEISMKDSGAHFEVQCGKRVTEFKAVPAGESKALLEAATFTGPTWDRLPERLLRDEKASYYLIDRLRTEDASDRRDFRLFIGPRGKMKLMSLKDMVDDSEGMIFSTKSGELRLVANRAAEGRQPGGKPPGPQLKWVSGKSEQPLTEVPLDDARNARMVYLELGPYEGLRLGTPCDDLL